MSLGSLGLASGFELQALEKDFNAAKQHFNGEILTLQACSLSDEDGRPLVA